MRVLQSLILVNAAKWNFTEVKYCIDALVDMYPTLN